MLNYVQIKRASIQNNIYWLRLLHNNTINYRLPEWTHRVTDPDGAFEYLRKFYMEFMTGTTELKRLKSGFLLKEIFDRFKNKTLSLLPEKLMHLYSGHNFTIASLLNSLGIFSVSFQCLLKILQIFSNVSLVHFFIASFSSIRI